MCTETSGHRRQKQGEDPHPLVTQLPLAIMEGHFDPRHFIDKIKIPGDESCNNGPHTDLVMFICTALRNLRLSKGSNIAISKASSSWIGTRQISKVITLFIGISDALNLLKKKKKARWLLPLRVPLQFKVGKSTSQPKLHLRSCLFQGCWNKTFEPHLQLQLSALLRRSLLSPCHKNTPKLSSFATCAQEICVPAAGMPPAEHEIAKTRKPANGENMWKRRKRQARKRVKTKTRKRRKRENGKNATRKAGKPFLQKAKKHYNQLSQLGKTQKDGNAKTRKRQKVFSFSSCLVLHRSSPFRRTLNTKVITALGICKVCTEAAHSVALWTRYHSFGHV